MAINVLCSVPTTSRRYAAGGNLSAGRAGSTITFGPLSVSQQGVSNGKELLPWYQIKGIEIQRGTVMVKKEGKRLNWSSVRVPQIPNFFVFNALVDHVITAK